MRLDMNMSLLLIGVLLLLASYVAFSRTDESYRMSWIVFAARCVLAAMVGAALGFFILGALVIGLMVINWGWV